MAEGTTIARYGALSIKYLTRLAQVIGAIIAVLLIAWAFSGESDVNFFEGVAILLLSIGILIAVVVAEILVRGMDRLAKKWKRSPESDIPLRDLDPTGEIAGVFESDRAGADRESLEEFVRKAEAGEYGSDPDIEAAARIVRKTLEHDNGS